MSEHSKGPWNTGGIAFKPNSAQPTTSIWGPIPQGKQSGELIAKDVSLGNARLIVLAPDLLAELKSLRGLIRDLGVQDADDSWNEAVARADAVIAKVTP